ncbi:MAG TPA: hypothetical protein VML35_04505 [Gaiellaceae bacterium]|nr:hypothetical protein [Gaiellaceae bacterium]
MRRGRIMTGAIVCVTVGLLTVSSAFAATPSEIAKDLADGKLDGTYTQQELESYLRDATVQGYPPPPQTPPPGVQPPPGGESPVTPAQPPAPEAGVAGVQTPPSSGGTPETGVAGEQSPVESPLEQTAQVGSLPFTGIDLLLLVVGGVVLLALGLGARAAGRRA